MNDRTAAPPEPVVAGREFLAGGGEMGERMRAFAWDDTPLGPPQAWAPSLKTAVRIMLTSRQPIWIGWGRDLIYMYNDPYLSIIGGKHPWALGRPTAEVWQEIWGDISPMLSTAMAGDEGTYVEEQLLIMERHGYREETYYTFSYSPIPGENADGGAGGIICANTEDTQRVVGERQLKLLRDLAAKTADARRSQEAFTRSAQALSAARTDLLFAAIYVAGADADRVTLAGVTGVEAGHPLAPHEVAFDDPRWPFATVVDGQEPVLLDPLPDCAGECQPCGAWTEPVSRVAVVPISTGADGGRERSVLVVGLNPYRQYDDGYRGYLGLVAGQIGASAANARAYEEERRRAESLAALDRAKTAFFSNVSHEFRTPLTLMLGPVEELLGRVAQSPGDRQLLALVHRNGLRLQKLVNTLLDFSRIEAGRMEARYQATDLAASTAELASNFRSACESAGVELVVDCPPLVEPVYVDRGMWEKIVLNVISNAFKFTLQGRIEVRLRERDGNAELEVADTGTGIPEAEMPLLFERFHRVEGARGRTQEGSGIGLALVHELVRLHGGTVTARSEVNRGTTMHIRIPSGTAHLDPARIVDGEDLAATSATAAPYVEEALRWVPGTEAQDAPGSDAPPPDAPRVVLADDNADMRDYVCRLLASEHRVQAVADGQAALDAITADPPDLVLADVMMPVLDGFELLAALRRRPETRELPVILLSARAGEEARVEGLEAGADDYLTKPFSARELATRVSTHIALTKMRREAAAALRESEARFRNMADAAPVMIWMTDRDGRCVYLNERWYRFTGTDPGSGLRGGWLECVHPDDRDEILTEFEAANHRQVAFRLECRLRRADGVWRWVIDSAEPRLDENGVFLGYIGSMVDITERKAVETRLREADRRKDEFLATLAHELRNPLAPIRSGLELLSLTRDQPETVAEVRETMARQVQQLVTLIDDLMDVSRITRGKLELRASRIIVADVVRSAVEAAKPLIDGKGHALLVTMPDEPVEIVADPFRMAQVLSNLLNNAAKYTREGGRIELDVRTADDSVVFQVTDNGIGIAAADQQRVFDMFSQVRGPDGRALSGLGIGLTLVKSLVALHGGEVAVHSDGAGCGSRFQVRLPVAPPREPDRAPVDTGEAGGGRRGRRVLVVDDNRDAAVMMSAMVKLTGHEVRTAGNGREAVSLADAFRPDVILMDIGMPEMDGYEAARRIRAHDWGEAIVLVAITGWGQEEDKRRTREAGFDRHLVKPADPDELFRILDGA